MALQELLRKAELGGDVDFLRDGACAGPGLMEVEVATTGAPRRTSVALSGLLLIPNYRMWRSASCCQTRARPGCGLRSGCCVCSGYAAITLINTCVTALRNALSVWRK
jgi:hypothetical protein